MVESLQERVGRPGVSTESDGVSEMSGRAREAAKEYLQKGYKFAADKAQVAKQSTEGYIKTNPWYAVGIALGTGVLLGMLIKTRWSRD